MRRKSLILVLGAVLSSVLCLLFGSWTLFQARAYTYIPDSCFEMSGHTLVGYKYKLPDCPSQNEDELRIPSSINWKKVTAIGDGAFNPAVLAGNEHFYSIFWFHNLYIPEWVTSIGKRAFQNNRFKYVSLPNSLISIGDEAFNHAFEGELEYDSWGFPDYHSPDISRGKNLKTIGKSAFANNGFTDISLPDSLEVIWDSAFKNAFYNPLDDVSDNRISLWKGVKIIWDSAFEGNQLISDLTIPASVEHIGKRAFADNRLDSAMLSSPKTTIGEGSFDHNTDAYEGNIKSPFPIFQPWVPQVKRNNIIINPLKLSIRCKDEKWSYLSNCSRDLVGPEKSDFSTWTEATSGEYFKPDITYTIIPAVLSGYRTPSSKEVKFPLNPNGTTYSQTIKFTYHKESYCSKGFNSQISTGECKALADFYSSTHGENWENKNWWSASLKLENPVPICDWFGVRCDTTGKIVQIVLPNNNLRGAGLWALAELSSLQALDLSQNQLNQQIPRDFYTKHPHLASLNLSSAGLNGPLVFDGGSSLKELNLSKNAFVGKIPASLANNSALEMVNLSDNYLIESIPAALFRLERIKSFDVSKNYIAGLKTNIFSKKTNRHQQRIVFTDLKGSLISSKDKLNAGEEVLILLKKQIYSPANGKFVPAGKINTANLIETSNNINVVGRVDAHNDIQYTLKLRNETSDGFFTVTIGEMWDWTQAKIKLSPNQLTLPVEEDSSLQTSWQKGKNQNPQQGRGINFELGGKYLDEYFSAVHFNVAGNDFGGGFFWLPVKKLSAPVAIQTRDASWELVTRYCENQIRGFYYNSQRWERLWPLDQESKDALQRFSPGTYDSSLGLQGGWYTSCEGDPYGVYGAIIHTYKGQDFHLNAGVAYDPSANKMKSDGLKCNFQRLNNSYPFWYIYDDHGHIGFVGAKIRKESLWNSAKVDQFHAGLNQLLDNGMCISSIFNYDWQELWYSTTNPIPGFPSWKELNDFLDMNPGSAKTTLFNLGIRGIVGLTEEFNNEEKKYFEGNTKDSTLLVRTDETISQVINLARKNAERLCRGKWQKTPQDLSSTIICIRGDDSETTPLRGGANSLSGKVVIIQNANLYLEPNQTLNSGPITLFIDRGNLFLPSSSATGGMQTFDSFGYAVDCANHKCAKANYLKGNFIINGLLLGGEDGKSAIKNKLYIHGKLVSFNTFRQPTVSRISTIQKTFGSKWTDEYRSMISFDNLFTWRCNLDRGSDGTWCKGLSKAEREAAGQSSILVDKAFGLIDMNFANLLFK